jgi:hypothetical protein
MNAVHSIQRVEQGRNVVFIWMGAAVVVAGAALLFVFDPARYAFYPRCVFKMLTGLDCPGCGGLRATHQLLHGHVREAFAFNSLFVASLPAIGFLIARAGVERLTGRKWRRLVSATTAIWVVAAIVIAFGVLRNLPWRVWSGN